MTVAAALLDSNVIIAALAGVHEHHAASLALFTQGSASYAVAAHSFAEVYATLTRRGDHAPFRFTAEEAWAALESLRAVTVLIGLTPAQTVETVRTYAADGGIGARLYDALIGETAAVYDLPAIITWNTRHMAGLFPRLDIVTPAAFLRR